MTRLKYILIVSILSLFLVQPAQGQRLLKNLSNKVMKKAEDRFEKKADEKIDEGLDKAEDELLKESDNENNNSSNGGFNLQNIMNNMGLSGDPVHIEDNYGFDHLIQMRIESFNKKGKKISEGEFITHMNSKAKSMAYQTISGDMADQSQGMFIIDTENGAMIMLNDEGTQKTGVVFGMEGYMNSLGETYEEVELEDTPDNYLANPNVKKTGRTKTIAGFKCEEFTYNDEDMKSNIWITKDMKLNTQDFFSTLFKTSIYSHGMGWGYMMGSTTVDITSGEKSVMQVTKVDNNSKVKFTMSDYEITNMGSFQQPKQEE